MSETLSGGPRAAEDPALPSVAALRAEQRQCWQRGERLLVEAYLRRYPALAADPEGVLDLIYNEVVLREERGEAPRLDEYLARFPQFAGPLRDQFHLHQVLEGNLASAAAATQKEPPTVAGGGPSLLGGAAEVRVPGYEVLAELGRGGMGVVYQARQVGLNRVVALKMILADAHVGARERTRFHMEAEAVARLQHPHIVQIYETGEVGGRPFLSLEYLGGGSLAQKLNGTPLPPREAARLVETLAGAVAEAHRRGVVHRDLKPANVMLTVDGTPKVSDFGLAKRLEGDSGQTKSGDILGTPSYMAPEQAEGRTQAVGPVTDVYALGAILYECLTGRPLFVGATPWDTVLQVRGQEPVPPTRLQPKVPRDLETVCLKCLQKAPAKRYASARELAEDLRRFQAGEPIRARPVGPVERLGRWCRRNPRVAGLLAVLLVVLASGLTAVTSLWLLAEERRRLAEDRLDESNRQYQRAEANLDKAHAAVDDCFSLASEHELLQGDGMQPVRKLLLATTLRYYQDFIQQRQNDPAMERDLALAYLRIGVIAQQIDSVGEALEAFQQALARYQELASRDPGDDRLVIRLAATHNGIGQLYQATGQLAAALASYRQAYDLLQPRALRDTDNPQVRGDLGLSCRLIGAAYRKAGRWAEARAAYHEARTIFQDLIERTPDAQALQLALANTYQDLGLLHQDMGRSDEALRSFQQAHAIHQKLVERHPRFQSELAGSLGHIGKLYHQTGRLTEAQATFEEARGLFEKVADRNPEVTRHQSNLARVYYNLGVVQRALGRPAEALGWYQRAYSLFRTVVQKDPDNSTHRQYLAESCLALARVQRPERNQAEALRWYREGHALQQELVARHPDEIAPRMALGKTYNNMGTLQYRAGQRDAALGLFQQSHALYQQLAVKHPGTPEIEHELALAYLGLGPLHQDARRLPDAQEAFQRARDILEKLVENHGEVSQYRDHLAGTYNNLGLLQRDARQPAEALPWYRKARALWEPLAASHPGMSDYRDKLALACNTIGNLELQTKQPAGQALCSFEQARDLWQKLADEDPEHLDYRHRLGGSVNNIGNALRLLGRLEEALKAYQQAVEHQRPVFEQAPHQKPYRQFLSNHYRNIARVQRQLGRPAEAAAATRERQKLWPEDAAELYKVGGELARCIPLVGKGRAELTAEEQAERRRYADDAMEALRQAVGNGYKDLEQLKKDAALAPLRSREDFKKLLKELEEKAKLGTH